MGRALLSVCLLTAIVAQAEVSPSCHSASFKVTLDVYDDFEQPLGGALLLRVRTLKEQGWFIDIVPAEATTNDYIYPVNPPLRFNSNQYLGAAYGESVKSSLAYAHEMRFLLDRNDYGRVYSLIGNVLWPYQTADPDRALSDYRSAAKHAKKGWLKVSVSSYKLDRKTDDLARIELRVRVTTPVDFSFAPGLKSRTVTCPLESD